MPKHFPESSFSQEAPATALSIPELIRQLLKLLGENTSRPGIKKTPERFAKAITELTAGYSMDADSIINGAIYPHEGTSGMVLVRDIGFSSLCEHHLLPFTGKAHVAYIPKDKIIGLSKIPRIVQMFARRLQIQENLTAQIAQVLEDKLSPLGIGVLVEAKHMCLEMRGAKSRNSKMITTAFRGKIQDCPATRSEFFSLVQKF